MSVDAKRLMTVPDEINENPFLTVTGNDYISLPEIDGFGRVLSMTVLHHGLGGLIEVRGDRPPKSQSRAGQVEKGEKAERGFLLAPYLRAGEQFVPLNEKGPVPAHRDLHDWIPEFTWRGLRVGDTWASLTARVVAPPEIKGFVYVLTLEADGPVDAELGIILNWAYTGLRVFSSRPLGVSLAGRFDRWTRAMVCEAGAPLPLLALAVNGSEDFACMEFSIEKEPACQGPVHQESAHLDDGLPSRLHLEAGIPARLASGGKVEQAFFIAAQREGDGARTTSMHLRRLGHKILQDETEQWLSRHRRCFGGEMASHGVQEPGLAAGERVVNRNLLFNYFFATGKTLDTEELVTVTSRSPRYYVSAAFWSRDALLWSFPGLLLMEPERAREALLHAFRYGTKNVGEHAQYIDGTALYPGFELDEAAAYLVALGRYLEETGDWTVAEEPAVLAGMERVLAAIARWKRPIGTDPGFLIATFLDPSDDPVTKPFLTYDNVLAWRALLVAATVLEKRGQDSQSGQSERERAAGLRREADELAAAIKKHCVVPGPFGPMFAWAVDGEGGYLLYDNPPGSLELLGYYGFSEQEVLENTRRWIWSRENAFFRDGRFSAPASAHTPHPWPLAAANRLLAETSRVGEDGGTKSRPRVDVLAEAIAFLTRAAMDNGLACESVDSHTGLVKTGAAFATAAGFIAYALWRGQRC